MAALRETRTSEHEGCLRRCRGPDYAASGAIRKEINSALLQRTRKPILGHVGVSAVKKKPESP
jgi:hypothetical protein